MTRTVISEIIAKLLEILETQHNKTCFYLFLLFSICFYIKAVCYDIFNVFSHSKIYPKTKTIPKKHYVFPQERFLQWRPATPRVHRLPLNPQIIIAAETHPSRVHIMYIISYISEIIAKLLEIFEIQHNKTCFHLFLLFSICFYIRALCYDIFNVFSHPKMYPKTKTTKKNIKFPLIFFFAMVAGDPISLFMQI